MKFRLKGFEWDKGNIAKCQKHGLAIEMIEEFFRDNILSIIPDIKHSTSEDRLTAIGRMKDGRPVFVAFTMRDGKVRPITARYMHLKEIARYEK